jgi:glycosyltransferase involved in cell wall biosynthesis
MSTKIAQVAVADLSIRFLLLSQIKHLERTGFQVEGISAAGPWQEEIQNLGLSYRTISIEREPSLFKDISSLVSLVRLFRREHYRIVNTHTPKAGLLGPLAARLAGVPHIIHTVHGFMFHDRMPRFKALFFWCVEKWTSVFSHYLFFQSLEDTETAVRSGICKKEKVVYIGNGIDLKRFDPRALALDREAVRAKLGFKPDDFVVGTVGRLVYEKGFREFFEIARRALKTWPNIKFLIVGPEEGRDQKDAVSAEEIAEMKATGRVQFLGMRKDLPELYSAMDAFLLMSHREGIPRALMEASAMELPCIATNIRGCREVIKKDETGVLVEIKDIEGALAAIAKLISNAELRKTFGERARKHTRESFDEDLVNERIEIAFRKILGEKARWAA